MHSKLVCTLALLSLLLSSAAAAITGRQTPDAVGEVAVTDAQLAKALEEAKAAAGQPRLFHQNLVDARPLVQPDKWNWYSSNYSVFRNADEPTDTFLGLKSVERGNLESGVLNLTLEWKPLPNVTAEMVEWMFGNLHKEALSPFDNKTYPMYTLLHPVDHITFLAKPEPVGQGSTFTFLENPNSECTYQPDSFDEPYVCPPGRKGFTKATPEAVWAKAPQTNATLVVDELNRTSCIWHKSRDLPHFGNRVIITSKMTWEDTPEGLVLRASRLAGVMAPNRTNEFETASPDLLRQANEVVRVAYLDGGFNNNITQAAYFFATHWGQEWAGMQAWLPQVHANSANKLVGPDDELELDEEAVKADKAGEASTANKAPSRSNGAGSTAAAAGGTAAALSVAAAAVALLL